MTDKALSFDGAHLLQSKDKTRKTPSNLPPAQAWQAIEAIASGELAQPPPVSASIAEPVTAEAAAHTGQN
jgi:hypothetical protein